MDLIGKRVVVAGMGDKEREVLTKSGSYYQIEGLPSWYHSSQLTAVKKKQHRFKKKWFWWRWKYWHGIV